MRWVVTLGIVVSAAMALASCGGGSTTTVTTTSSVVIRMPSVIDRQQADAEAILRGAGFKLSYLAVPNQATPGTVIAQYPAPGSRFAKGSEVTLTISARPGAGHRTTIRGATQCGGSIEFTGIPRQAKDISATLAHCGEALALVTNAHRLLNSCPKGEHCDVGDYSCTQAYYGGPTLFVRCVSRGKPANAPGPVAEVFWQWAGYDMTAGVAAKGSADRPSKVTHRRETHCIAIVMTSHGDVHRPCARSVVARAGASHRAQGR